jgi:5-(carboxyamino)imidazole ribonucleotide mutase
MPSGVPVATVALDGATNAGILAAQILATSDASIAAKLTEYKKKLKDKVGTSVRELKIAGYNNGFDQAS